MDPEIGRHVLCFPDYCSKNASSMQDFLSREAKSFLISRSLEQMKRHLGSFVPLLIAALIMALTGGLGSLLAGARVKTRIVSFQVEPGVMARGILTVPAAVSLDMPAKEGATKPPIIFLLPGIISLADRFEGMAGELGRRNYASLAIYFPNDNTRLRLKTVKAAARCIESAYPQINSSRRAYFGHSLGGTTAVDAAYFDDNAYAAVSVGYYIGGELAGSPKNLLIGTGIYDDLNDREKLRSSIRSITEGRVTREGLTEGSFVDRTARELFISPYSNHASEKEDSYIIRRLLEWLDLSFYGQKAPEYEIVYPVRVLSIFLAMTGFFVILCASGMVMRRKGVPPVEPLWASACVLAGFLLLRCQACPLFWARVLLLIFCSWFFITYFTEREKNEREHYDALEAFSAGFISFAGKIILFVLAFSLSQFIFCIPFFLEDQRLLSAFPGYLSSTFFITGCSYIDAFMSYSCHFIPGIWIGLFCIGSILLIGDFMRPGRIVSAFVATLERTRSFMKFQRTQHVPPRQKIGLALLSLLMVLSWVWLYRSGFLGGGLLTTYVLFILRYAILPIAFFGVGASLAEKIALKHGE
jgi:hypothetical protein